VPMKTIRKLDTGPKLTEAADQCHSRSRLPEQKPIVLTSGPSEWIFDYRNPYGFLFETDRVGAQSGAPPRT
jgi:hypothetical protein